MTQELLKTYASRMKELQAEYDELHEKMKIINAEYDDLRLKKIPELMSEMEIRTVTFEGIGRVQTAGDMYASIKADVRGEAYSWLRDHGFSSLITETVNASTLKAFAKEQTKKGEELPEDLFSITPFTRASIVKK